MQAPGGLRELDIDAAVEWDRLVAAAMLGANPPPQVLATADKRTPDLTGPDWPAMPARIQSCLGRKEAHALLDWQTEAGDEGRRLYQEEYLEWRVVRAEDGNARRIEMTTEFGDYWKVLAGYQPDETLKLVASFAGEETIAPATVYGDLDPFAADVDPSQRSAAFAATMLAESGRPVASPYNNGQSAICCMVEASNTLRALINLVSASAEPHVVVDSVTKEPRPMSGSEAIQVIRQGAAQDCRNSDPVVVERVVRLATEGRLIAFDDPIGVYIRGVEHRQLIGPDGSDVPAKWFELGRGIGPNDPVGQPRYQRLAFEVPDGVGFTVADLKQRETGDRITHGAQLAELVTLGVYMRTSATAKVAVALQPETLRAVTPCTEQPSCDEVRAHWAAFESAERERAT